MYAKEVLRVLNNDEILKHTSDKKLYKIKAKNETTPYITYKCINSYAGFRAEGERKTTVYVIQIDINRDDTKFKETKKSIIKQAKINGWKRESSEFEDFDDNVGVFFSCLRFSFALFEEE